MGNALWLLFALPSWFFSSMLAPFSAGPLTAIPALGILCLALGIYLGVKGRGKRLFSFVLSPLLSHVLVAIAGALRGQVTQSSGPILLCFIALQALLCGVLIYRLKGHRFAATALSVFSMSYALFASFVAGMAFSDSWL